MTIKITALTTSACVACLYVLSLISPSDPFFFFISSNFFVSLARLLLAVAILFLITRRRFKYKISSSAVSLIAVAIIVFGLAGLAIPSMDYALFNIFKPFDYIYFIGSGFYLGYYSMAIARGRRKLRLLKLAHSGPLRSTQRLSKA